MWFISFYSAEMALEAVTSELIGAWAMPIISWINKTNALTVKALDKQTTKFISVKFQKNVSSEL